MEKDFFGWTRLKATLNRKGNQPYFHEGEIWWCSIGLNIGIEMDGKHEYFERPVFILRKFNADTCWVLPSTSKHKAGAYYVPYKIGDTKYAVSLSQVRLIDAKRLRRRVAVLPKGTCRRIVESFIALL